MGQDWRQTCERWRWQCLTLHERLGFDGINFTQHPGYLGIQIGRKNAGRVRIVWRRWKRWLGVVIWAWVVDVGSGLIFFVGCACLVVGGSGCVVVVVSARRRISFWRRGELRRNDQQNCNC